MTSGLHNIVVGSERNGDGKKSSSVVASPTAATSSMTRPSRLRALTASSIITSSTSTSSSSSSAAPLSFALSSSSFSSQLSSSSQVRCKYFHKIGVISPTAMNRENGRETAERCGNRQIRSMTRFYVPLKDANGVVDEKMKIEHQPQQSSHRKGHIEHPSSLSSLRIKKQVEFDTSVTVVPIPMRSEYSNRIKSKMWWGKLELYETAERNLAEYAAENYNWRNVCPEEEMYVCIETNELVHPVHVDLGLYSVGPDGKVNKVGYNCY